MPSERIKRFIASSLCPRVSRQTSAQRLILSVTASPDVVSGGNQVVIGFIIDKSGSMAGDRIAAVRGAVGAAIGMLPDTAWFFVVAFDSTAQVVVRETCTSGCIYRGEG